MVAEVKEAAAEAERVEEKTEAHVAEVETAEAARAEAARAAVGGWRWRRYARGDGATSTHCIGTACI